MAESKAVSRTKRQRRYFGSLMRWLRLTCVLLIIFDFTTTVFFSIGAMKKSSLDTIARAESQISQYIRSVWNLGDAIAAAPATRDDTLSLRQRARMLVPYADAYDLFMLGITNEEGLVGSTLDRTQITSTAMLTDEGIGDLSSRPAFQEMMATGNSILTDTYPAGADGETMIYTIWIPYYDHAKIAGAITVSIKFAFIENIITSTSLENNYYFTLLDSQNNISANADTNLVNVSLDEAYEASGWVSLPLEELDRRLKNGVSGNYWGVNNNRLEYVTYMPVAGTPWKLVMRTDFFGSFRSTFFSLAIKMMVYLSLLILFSLRKSRDVITRERLFNMMTGNVNEVFLAYNLDQKKMEYASGNSMRVLGVPADDWLSHPEQAGADFGFSIGNLVKSATESAYSVDARVTDPQTGKEHPLRFRVYKVLEDGVAWAIMVITDETEEQEKKQALQQAVAAAERASQAKSDFLSSMSHDIRTPMNAIVGMVAIAAANLDDREKVADCLHKVQVSSQHLLDMISGVLDMSRIESGKLELNCRCFNLRQLLQDLSDLFQVQADGKKITFSLEYEKIEHANVYGDALRLNQIVMNLVQNALKFTPEGGTVRIAAQELPCAKEGFPIYQISVRDTGIGIEPQWIDRLFEPFERVERSTISKIEGSGLGLAIVKRLVELMGGTIEVESISGQGSCFCVRLPLERRAAEEEAPSRIELPASNSALHEERPVLLVEDNEINMEIARELLEMAGLTVDTAWNGAEAIKMFEASSVNRYSMIMTDIQMPQMDGYEEARIIRSLERPDAVTVPIIAISADATPEARRRAEDAGMNGYITKPIDPTQLTENLKSYLLK